MINKDDMAWQEVEIWKFYESEIRFFKKISDDIFIKTILHETKIENIKQQKLRVSEEDIDQLLELIKISLKAIAIVSVYRDFQAELIPPSNENKELFYTKRDQRFENLLMIFLLKVKNDQEIDFTIS